MFPLVLFVGLTQPGADPRLGEIERRITSFILERRIGALSDKKLSQLDHIMTYSDMSGRLARVVGQIQVGAFLDQPFDHLVGPFPHCRHQRCVLVGRLSRVEGPSHVDQVLQPA